MEGNRYALLIGNSNYQDESLPGLRCPENDVDDFERVLRSEAHGHFTEVIPLKNSSAIEARRKISQILKTARREDLVLIYFSGHGKLDIEGSLHVATTDTEVNDLEVTSIPV